MALVRPPPHELNPLSVNEISTENAEKSVLLDKPEKERLHRLAAPRRKIYLISAKLALFSFWPYPISHFASFVHYYNVPIGRSGVRVLPFLHCEQYHS